MQIMYNACVYKKISGPYFTRHPLTYSTVITVKKAMSYSNNPAQSPTAYLNKL